MIFVSGADREAQFVRQIAERRIARGLSQTEFAKVLAQQGLKFHQTTVARVEEGSRPLKLAEGVVIANVLQLEDEFAQMLDAEPADEAALRTLFDELWELRDDLVDAVYRYGAKRRDLLEALDEAAPGVVPDDEEERMRSIASLRAIADFAEIKKAVDATIVKQTWVTRDDVDET